MVTGVVWFRRDLRLADNPALHEACKRCTRLVPVYIHAPEEDGDWPPGAASRWWLHRSLAALDAALRAIGSRLLIRRGGSLDALCALIAESGAAVVYFNRLYEPLSQRRDRTVARALLARGTAVVEGNAALLHEPWVIANAQGRPYKVFTAYARACRRAGLETRARLAPTSLPAPPPGLTGVALEALGLWPRVPWDAGLRETWRPGEAGAWARLADFVERGLSDYATGRDRPGTAGTSRLSPHLHFGEIGPRQVLAAVEAHVGAERRAGTVRQAEAFVRELLWREFAHHLLHHFPRTPEAPLDERFARFRWRGAHAGALRAWQGGRTGLPIVDAGLRELRATGWMHNRVRMIAASLLVKNLLIPWQAGARWFWDTLVDADLASNTLGWQWVAGCGADAAPYFRIFNPVTQGRRHDPDGRYVRRWLPELAALPARHVHAPWRAPEGVLRSAGLVLGRDYPHPMVDLGTSRAEALARFAEIKRG